MTTATRHWKKIELPPVSALVDHRSWGLLRRSLEGNASWDILKGAPNELQHLVLAAPCAVALWLRRFRPDLLARPTLHIVVADADCCGIDCVDSGKWYQFIPLLANAPCLRVTVEFLSRVPARRTRHPNTCTITPLFERAHLLQSATIFDSKLGAAVEQCSERAIDLVFCFTPDFGHRSTEWFAETELPAAVRLGIPVGFAAQSKAEFFENQWLVDAYGYATCGRPVENPFDYVMGDYCDDLSPRHAHILWALNPRLPDYGFAPDAYRLAQFADYHAWLDDKGFEFGRSAQFAVPGERIEELELEGEDSTVFLANGMIVNMHNGECGQVVWDLGQHHYFEPAVCLSDGVLSSYPENPKFSFERALWSVEASKEASFTLEVLQEVSATKSSWWLPTSSYFKLISLLPGVTPDDKHVIDLMRESVNRAWDMRDLLSTPVKLALADLEPYVVKPDQKKETSGARAIFRALRSGRDAEAFRELKLRSDLINARSTSKSTPAIEAAAAGQRDMLQFLVEKRADMKASDEMGYTALHVAAEGGQLACVRLLLRSGIDVDARTHLGWTALGLALEAYKRDPLLEVHLEIARVLIHAGAISDAPPEQPPVSVPAGPDTPAEPMTPADAAESKPHQHMLRMHRESGGRP
ncbi:hypothetical protein P3T23_001047 [Paraburkholderia sp. GAS448]|uniref:ankyrin repeat domain-containing protein n=1 Tax=Paraburkholderia sp. GAS448 TaxID=3035136 RepID=UPI003D1ABB7F